MNSIQKFWDRFNGCSCNAETGEFHFLLGKLEFPRVQHDSRLAKQLEEMERAPPVRFQTLIIVDRIIDAALFPLEVRDDGIEPAIVAIAR